jgi:hypothetical protein
MGIKFRGYRTSTKEWVYGYYVKDPQGKHRIYYQPFDKASSNTYYFVEEDSVSQFTGIKDIDGEDIYTKDILKSESGETVEVRFVDLIQGNYVNRLEFILISGFCFYNNSKVIGNVYEHKELIKND